MSELTWYNTAMTSNTTPVPLVASASSSYGALLPWKAFSGTLVNVDDCWLVLKTGSPYLQLDFGKETNVQAFRIKCRLNSASDAPNTFTISGSNDPSAGFSNLHTTTNKTDWVSNQYYTVELNSQVKYRYYRLQIASSNGSNSYVGIGLFEFGYYPPPPPINKILLSKNNKGYITHIEDTWYETKMTSNTAPAPYVASASSTQSATYAPWKAFDGTILPLDNQSSWSATSTLRSGWLQLDYGTIKPVNKLSLTILEFTTSPKDFQILGSNDNANWTTLLDIKGEVWIQGISNETKEYHLPETANNRYYRINISTVSAPNKQPMITELKYGYEKKELTEISKIDKDVFVKHGKDSFNNLDSDFNSKVYVLNDVINNTASTQLNKKPLSIRID